MFRLENSRTPSDVAQVLSALVEWLAMPQQHSLRWAFTVWLKRVFLPNRVAGVSFTHLNDLQEVRIMLAERVVEWTEEWKQQGLQQGLQQGRQQGEATLLLRQLERRFGPVDEALRQRVQTADAETLLLWGERILSAATLAAVLEE